MLPDPLHLAAILFLLALLVLVWVWNSRSVTPRPVAVHDQRTLQPVTPHHLRQISACELSVVVPAYNEVDRLPGMLDEAWAYLEKRRGDSHGAFSYEIVVMDDGSADATSKIALRWGKDNGVADDALRVMKLEVNRGKGAAVTQGILRSRGRRILFADADGATKFSDLALLEHDLEQLVASHASPERASAVVVGSRAHLVSTEVVIQRSPIRNLLMRAFHTFLHILGVRHIKDTQCGFKLFTRRAAQRIFPSMHTQGWIFDVEILLLAEELGIRVVERSVNWTEIDGSKMNLIRDAVRMAVDLLVIRVNYTLGVWTILPDADDYPPIKI